MLKRNVLVNCSIFSHLRSSEKHVVCLLKAVEGIGCGATPWWFNRAAPSLAVLGRCFGAGASRLGLRTPPL